MRHCVQPGLEKQPVLCNKGHGIVFIVRYSRKWIHFHSFVPLHACGTVVPLCGEVFVRQATWVQPWIHSLFSPQCTNCILCAEQEVQQTAITNNSTFVFFGGGGAFISVAQPHTFTGHTCSILGCCQIIPVLGSSAVLPACTSALYSKNVTLLVSRLLGSLKWSCITKDHASLLQERQHVGGHEGWRVCTPLVNFLLSLNLFVCYFTSCAANASFFIWLSSLNF